MLHNKPAEREDALPASDVARVRESGLFDAGFYATSNPDLTGLGDRMAAHYCLQGWRENRKPNFYFDPAWYLAQYEDVREAGIEPLLHYIVQGEAEGRRPCKLFDPNWYGPAHAVPEGQGRLAHLLAHRRSGRARAIAEFDAAYYLRSYPDIAQAGIDPFEHYLVQGFREARRPFEGFDPQFYRHRYLRGLPDINPLLHFIAHRADRGVHPSLPPGETTIGREVKRNTGPDPAFETRVAMPRNALKRARVLSYYLPQYHAIAENDAWWGAGFTEWTNVARALPRFAGHYQPRTPRDLGHYSLDAQGAKQTLARQIEFARDAAIDGFVFYFYWFNGRRLLEGPLETLLADRTLDFPFCLMWTNENWTRRWDGSTEEILIGQDYETDDEGALLACFARHFADPRYIRIGGRPLLMVYRPGLIPEIARAVARWRQVLSEDEPILVLSQSFGDTDPRPFGFDGAVEFPPHKVCEGLAVINQQLDILDTDFHAQVYSYADVVRASLAEPAPDFPLIKTVAPSWDNDARRQGGGLVLHGSTPSLYQHWLEQLVLRASDHPFFGEPIVCVNAWNEWAEGAYLEPDLHFGAAYLNATGRAITGAAPAERLLLVGHDGLRHGAQMLLLHLAERLVRNHGVAIDILLLGSGPLETDFASLGPTTTMSRDDPGLVGHLRRLKRDGMTASLVNSLASGDICPLLQAQGTPSVLLAHEMPGLLREKGLLSSAAAGLGGATKVVVAAAEVAAALAKATGFDQQRAVVLPQGLYQTIRFCRSRRDAVRRRLGIASADLVVLGLGYADTRKGFDVFLQLWRMLAKGNDKRRGRATAQSVHFIWAGGMDPDLGHYLGPEIETAIESGSFHLPGFVDDPSDMLSAADCHALTSREDPFPSVVLEALASGLRTVAFEATGGIPTFLRQEAAGEVVARGDLAGFADALISSARNDSLPGVREQRVKKPTRFCFGDYARHLMHLARPVLDVSVAILSFNYADFMKERMDSVLSQSHPVREVIVFDDASADASVERARATATSHGRDLEVIISRVNSGSPFFQWRAAAHQAKGEWIWLAEADDAAEPRFLSVLADRLSRVPDAVLGFTDSRVIDAQGTPTASSYEDYYRRSECIQLCRDGVFEGPEFLRTCLAERNMILNASAVLFRRAALAAALDRCGKELDALRVAGDWRIYAEMLSEPDSRVVYVGLPLNIHRRHSASATHRLAARRHLVEVGQVHAAVARLGNIGAKDRARQRAYREELRSQFGLRVATR